MTLLRSLQYRDFRLFFAGQFVSLCGSWMQQTAQSWLVYRLTGDPFMLGLAALAGQFPVFLLGPYAGTRVDRWDLLALVRLTQAAAMVQAAVLAALAYSGRIEVWHVLALSAVSGSINAFDVPARQVLIGELVEPEVRHNALALNSAIVNGSRVLGPAAAGVLIARIGEAGCFALNAATFIAVLAALFAIRGRPRLAPRAPEKPLWDEIGEGLRYAVGCEPIRQTLFLLSVFSVFGMSVYVLMPVVADGLLGAGARGLGVLSSASGAGATVGALLLAGRATTRGLGRLIPVAVGFFGLALAGVAASRSLALSAGLFAVAGASLITVLAGTNTLLQELSDERYRGRIMSFYAMIFIGISPVGSFAVGAVAARVGAPATVGGTAVVLLVLAAAYLERLPRALGPKAQIAVGPSALREGAEGPDAPPVAPL